MPSARPSVAVFLGAALLAGCAAPHRLPPPEVPAALKPPPDQTLYLEALATGVQIYTCALKTDSGHEWVFKAPEATLRSRAGDSLGRHYAGPTWEAGDGSTVVGEVRAKDPGPDPSAIPWLLLAAKANSASGTFAPAKSIQRLATVGGQPPAQPCTEARLGELARVPYTATYYFYR